MKDSIEEKERRGVLKGYLTLEAAIVFPMVFALVIMLLYATFFLYDKCRMTQDLYTAAYRQSIARNGKAGDPGIDTSGYFMLNGCGAGVSGGSTVRATAEGSMAPALLIGTGRRTDPPQSFRRYRRIAAVARQAVPQGEN